MGPIHLFILSYLAVSSGEGVSKENKEGMGILTMVQSVSDIMCKQVYVKADRPKKALRPVWNECLKVLQKESSLIWVDHTEGSPDMSAMFEDGFDYLLKWEEEGKLRVKKGGIHLSPQLVLKTLVTSRNVSWLLRVT